MFHLNFPEKPVLFPSVSTFGSHYIQPVNTISCFLITSDNIAKLSATDKGHTFFFQPPIKISPKFPIRDQISLRSFHLSLSVSSWTILVRVLQKTNTWSNFLFQSLPLHLILSFVQLLLIQCLKRLNADFVLATLILWKGYDNLF